MKDERNNFGYITPQDQSVADYLKNCASQENEIERKNEYLALHDYHLFNRGRKTTDSQFLTLSEIGLKYNITQGQIMKLRKKVQFSAIIQCPICGMKTKAEMRNLHNPEVITDIFQCENCGHIKDDFIHSDCNCSICKHRIEEIQGLIENLPKRLEQQVSNFRETFMAKKIKKSRLKYYFDKNSSNLTRDERDLIAFCPKNVSELNEVFPTSQNRDKIFFSLLKKNLVFWGDISDDLIKKALLATIVFDIYSLQMRRSYYSITLNQLGLSGLKIKKLRSDEFYFSHPNSDQPLILDDEGVERLMNPHL